MENPGQNIKNLYKGTMEKKKKKKRTETGG
jgi:hypothetical protein